MTLAAQPFLAVNAVNDKHFPIGGTFACIRADAPAETAACGWLVTSKITLIGLDKKKKKHSGQGNINRIENGKKVPGYQFGSFPVRKSLREAKADFINSQLEGLEKLFQCTILRQFEDDGPAGVGAAEIIAGSLVADAIIATAVATLTSPIMSGR